ncbi:MAG: hypothetical protein H6585_04825 [Flavobacteriales bacterium]|nr:hypothetical protein [Flavobacteriales bacterium]MCB9447652.1 hypothetical protein [Flavobacteriales bacterium]
MNRLTRDDIQLLFDEALIRAKNNALTHLLQDMQHVRDQWILHCRQNLLNIPEPLTSWNAKIHRGENHHGLPWMAWDYPALMTTEDIFTFRTIFLWGQGITCTLQLQGHRLEQLRPVLESSQAAFGENWQMAMGRDPWEHRFVAPHYEPVASLSSEAWKKKIQLDAFVKIGRKLDGMELSGMEYFVKETGETILSLVFPAHHPLH